VSEYDVYVERALATAVPLRSDRRPAWDDVVRRTGLAASETTASRRSYGRAFALVVAVFAVAGALAAVPATREGLAAVGRDAFDGLSSWLGREPGQPASAREQEGFEKRNAAAYAEFPAGTQLRLLKRVRVAGRTYSLLGFRSHASLCLRLVNAARPAKVGANQCVTLRELQRSSAPALVAADAFFRAADNSVDGLFGFADDTVFRVEARRSRGDRTLVAVANNAFVVLRARRAGTVRDHPPYDPIVQVAAIKQDGRRVAVPYLANGMVDYTQASFVPSYLSFQRVAPADLPGPDAAVARFTGGTISWLDQREKRGQPWTPHFPRERYGIGTPVFSRAIQPDPADPLRVGVFVTRVAHQSRLPRTKPGTLVLCTTELRPLRGAAGYECGGRGKPWFGKGQPLMTSSYGLGQITQRVGLAADQVAAINVFLASGRVVPAALRDNVFSFSVPTAQLPAKIVAYDSRHRPMWANVLYGPPKPTPCPPARPVTPSTSRAFERIDLGKLTINGKNLFGHSPADVRAALGSPARVQPNSAMNGHAQPTYYYGYSAPRRATPIVQFGWRQHRVRALSFTYNNVNVVDAHLGAILRLQPEALQQKIQARYGTKYKLETPYGSSPGFLGYVNGCTGSFTTRDGVVRISFGIDPRAGARPTLSLSHGY
jgi:hypothetical protein